MTENRFAGDGWAGERGVDGVRRIKRLTEASVRNYRDSELLVDWDVPSPPGTWFKTEETLGLYGTPYWDLLDEEQRRRLSFLEVAHIWHTFIGTELVQVRHQMGMVYGDRRQERIPEVIKEYWTHFSKEELSHTLMFEHALRHFKVPEFPSRGLDGVSLLRLSLGGLNWISAAAIVVLAEWFTEETEFQGSSAEGMDPISRQIAIVHHTEEARHIRFGQEVIEAFWESQSAEEREKVVPLIVAITKMAPTDTGAHPDVLRAMKFEQPELQDIDEVSEVMRTCEYRVELNKKIYGKVYSFLRDVGIYNPSTAPTFAKGNVDHYFESLS